MAQGNFIAITPFVHVPDIRAAVAFFTDILGFARHPLPYDNYAYVYRETIAVRLMQNHGDDGAPPGNRRFSIYIDVKDVDGLYADLRPKLSALPEGDVMGPRDQPYGQRELMILAPDGNLIVFGQALGD